MSSQIKKNFKCTRILILPPEQCWPRVMSPEERDITAISDSLTAENRVAEIYNKIDEFGEKNKNSLAQALKKYWQARVKWKKKHCSKKQWIKAQKIKSILGE
jgi:hypothetical protein